MTNEEIMKMAHAAGWEQGSQFDDCGDCSRFDVVKFARMVAAAMAPTAEQMNAWVKNAADLAYAAGAEAERKACATIDVTPLRILAIDGPGTAILKYRAAIRARK